jgi:hypothetical protein
MQGVKKMKRTTFGLSAMTLSLVFGWIIALGSLLATRGQLDTKALTSQAFNLPTILVSCLDPMSILLEIAAIVLILRDSRQFGTLHRRLAWIAAIVYILWATANLLGFLPLSFISAMNGSRSMALTGQWIKALSALLAFLVPVLLVFGISSRALRAILGFGWLFSAMGGFGGIAISLSNFQLEAINTAGQTMYVTKLNVDYTQGLYPTLLMIGYIGGLLYLLVYAYLAWRISHKTYLHQSYSASLESI